MFSWVQQQTQALGRDLTEFATVVKSDAETIARHAELKRAAKSGAETPLQQFQGDIHVYTDPVGDDDKLAQWAATAGWSLAAFSEAVETTLAGSDRVATFHGELVPGAVSDEEFWKRYFFRLQIWERYVSRRGGS
ncbi:BSD domain-containing protein C22A12.14c [Diplonema papillatum]|nr:BSD domain-containing protein C22A12.14c [Diplonema papillatum]KAJ9436406.1 BSD domain-containing protein C22A12.14c [Diplonema papillatum]KAJ9454901.1 BSD domain-containing protein C22A12.14c [Diplonema papillatum]